MTPPNTWAETSPAHKALIFVLITVIGFLLLLAGNMVSFASSNSDLILAVRSLCSFSFAVCWILGAMRWYTDTVTGADA